MSTKIYDGHLWLGTAEELMGFLFSIREQYVLDATKYLLNWDYDKIVAYAQNFYSNQQSFYLPMLLRDEVRKGEDTPFNFDASIMVYFGGEKTGIIPFGLRMFPETEKLFKSHPKIKFYGYWDNVDPDESCSEKEFNERKEFYDKIFEKSYSFNTVGLTYELSNQESIFNIYRGWSERLVKNSGK
jgi:hypothetical protein